MLTISELTISGESYSLKRRSRSKFYNNASTIINKKVVNSYAESFLLHMTIESKITAGEDLNYKKLINKGYRIPGLDPEQEKLIKMMPTWGVYNFCKGFMEFIDFLKKLFQLKMDPAPAGARLALNKFTKNKEAEIDPNEVLRARRFLIGNVYNGNTVRPIHELFWQYLPILIVLPLVIWLGGGAGDFLLLGIPFVITTLCEYLLFNAIKMHLKNPLYVNKIIKFLDKHIEAVDDLIRQAEAKGDKKMLKLFKKERTRTDKNRERVEKIFATRKSNQKVEVK